jgi:hypothetical protein
MQTWGGAVRLPSSTEYAVTRVSGTESLLVCEGVLCDDCCGACGDASDIFANDCKPSKGEWELEFDPFPDPNSGMCNEMETGRL